MEGLEYLVNRGGLNKGEKEILLTEKEEIKTEDVKENREKLPEEQIPKSSEENRKKTNFPGEQIFNNYFSNQEKQLDDQNLFSYWEGKPDKEYFDYYSESEDKKDKKEKIKEEEIYSDPEAKETIEEIMKGAVFGNNCSLSPEEKRSFCYWIIFNQTSLLLYQNLAFFSTRNVNFSSI